MNVQRFYFLLRYHRWSQFLWRIYLLLTPALHKILIKFRSSPEAIRVIKQAPNLNSSNTLKSIVRAVETNGALNIQLLNRPSLLSLQLDWKDSRLGSEPILWKFHLHYHDYIKYFLSTKDPFSQTEIWSFIWRWIKAHPLNQARSQNLTWHAYVVSKRVQAWILLWQTLPPPLEIQETILKSIETQILWLELRLERDLGGNHLWENANALIFAGCLLEGPQTKRWKKLGISLLHSCINAQIDSNGEHFEKSPSYGFELMTSLFGISKILQITDPLISIFFQSIANKMNFFLATLAHPDGNLPLFGDSVEIKIETPAPLKSSNWLSDYFVHAENNHKLIFDSGNMGPDFLPAHSHADLLSFELSVQGKRFFVDSGTYCYEGEERNLYRGTEAHNVLMLNSIELADIWSSFRMGRRGHVTQRFHKRDSHGTWILATHDAYEHMGLGKVTRIWFLANNGPWFSFHFILNGPGAFEAEESLHLHPAISPKIENNSIRINCDNTFTILEPINYASVGLKKTFYSPAMNLKENNYTIRLKSWVTARRSIMGWSLSFDSYPKNPSITIEGENLLIQWTESGRLKIAHNHEILSLIG